MPLKGIQIVSLEHAVAAPFASRQLADLGAEVIKVEKPKIGDFARQYDERANGLSSNFIWLNRGKKSIELNLKESSDKSILLKILKTSDVLLNNLGPGVLTRLGLDPKELHEIYPQLIICSISGYGKEGPFSHKKAYDLLVQSESGVLSITGSEDFPAKTGIAIVDIASGMYALTSILAALFNRTKTNEGTIIEISMLEAIAEWMSFPIYYTYGGGEPKRTGVDHATIYPYGPFAVSSNEKLFIAIQNNAEWVVFCEKVLGESELALEPNYRINSLRVENKEELKKVIEKRTADLSKKELIELLDKYNIANADFNTTQGLIDHPQLKYYSKWKNVSTEVGDINMLKPPFNFNNLNTHWGSIPFLGEHNDEIRARYSEGGE